MFCRLKLYLPSRSYLAPAACARMQSSSQCSLISRARTLHRVPVQRGGQTRRVPTEDLIFLGQFLSSYLSREGYRINKNNIYMYKMKKKPTTGSRVLAKCV